MIGLSVSNDRAEGKARWMPSLFLFLLSFLLCLEILGKSMIGPASGKSHNMNVMYTIFRSQIRFLSQFDFVRYRAFTQPVTEAFGHVGAPN